MQPPTTVYDSPNYAASLQMYGIVSLIHWLLWYVCQFSSVQSLSRV